MDWLANEGVHRNSTLIQNNFSSLNVVSLVKDYKQIESKDFLHPDVGDTLTTPMKHLAQRPHGDGVGNKEIDGEVHLNAKEHDISSNPFGRCEVVSSLNWRIENWIPVRSTIDNHECTSHYGTS